MLTLQTLYRCTILITGESALSNVYRKARIIQKSDLLNGISRLFNAQYNTEIYFVLNSMQLLSIVTT